jgi:hypothetical protein
MSNIHRYTDEYKDSIFLTWYRNGTPPFGRLEEFLLPDAEGFTPSKDAIQNWSEDLDWKVRADLLTQEATAKAQIKLADERADMLVRHAQVGKSLIERGMEALENLKVETINDVVRMIALGTEIERKSRGGRNEVENIYEQSDKALLENITRMLGRSATTEVNVYVGNGGEKPDIVTGEVIEEDE